MEALRRFAHCIGAPISGELRIYDPQQQWRTQVAARLGGSYDTRGNAISLSISATTGFAFLPNCSGVPTGVPAGVASGLSAVVIDVTNYRLYFFAGGAWRNAGP